MKHIPAFLHFAPIYKDYLWGGSRIAGHFHRSGCPEPTAESWEISAHPDGDSTVDSGPLAGRTLSSLAAEFSRELLGSRSPSPSRFPLMAKVIDARLPLSVQVHPSPADPSANPSEFKNECWHILGTEGDCAIYAGISREIGDATSLRAIATGDPGALASALVRHSPREGETLFIPAGLVHAIGAGALVYEVQQNSNTTYRLYDWDRVGPDGKPRVLHLDAAIRSIDFSLPAPRFIAPSHGGAIPGSKLCLKTPYFELDEVSGSGAVALGGETFNIFFVKRGTFNLEADGGDRFRAAAGVSLLIPASASYSFVPAAPDSAAIVTSL